MSRGRADASCRNDARDADDETTRVQHWGEPPIEMKQLRRDGRARAGEKWRKGVDYSGAASRSVQNCTAAKSGSEWLGHVAEARVRPIAVSASSCGTSGTAICE